MHPAGAWHTLLHAPAARTTTTAHLLHRHTTPQQHLLLRAKKQLACMSSASVGSPFSASSSACTRRCFSWNSGDPASAARRASAAAARRASGSEWAARERRERRERRPGNGGGAVDKGLPSNQCERCATHQGMCSAEHVTRTTCVLPAHSHKAHFSRSCSPLPCNVSVAGGAGPAALAPWSLPGALHLTDTRTAARTTSSTC